MRRTWIIGGAAVIVAAIVVWALVSGAGPAPAAPGSMDAAGIVSASRPASRATTSDGLATTRIVPRRFEDPDANPVAAPIRVLVTDAAGHPVEAIQVLLVLKMRERSPWPTSSCPTGKDGLATVRAPSKVAVNAEVPFEWVVTVGIPVTEPPEAPVDIVHPPADPIRLVIGATGRAVVRVVDRANNPVLERAHVILEALRKDRRTLVLRLPQECGRTTDRGEALFEPVGIDTVLLASASCEGRRYVSETIGDGPRLPGAEVSLTVTVDVSKPFVTGRILDDRGDPWLETNFHGRLVCGEPRRGPSGIAIHTDAAGRFRVEVVEGLYEGRERRLEIEHEVGQYDVDARGAVDLTRVLPPGDTDVGDVPLVRPPPKPLIVSGTVVDDEGKPVGGARLQLERSPSATASKAQWESIPGLEHLPPADSAGRFEIRGTCEPGAFRVAAHEPKSWSDNPLEITLGQENAVLHVHRAGAMEGSVELPEGIDGKDVAVTVRLEDAGDRTWKAWGASVWTPAGLDGSFRFDQLRSGPFTVSVKPSSELLFLPVEIAGVVVRAGETTRDPRLQKIQLPSRGRPIFLTVVDSEGRDVPRAEAAEIGLPAGPRLRDDVARARDQKIRIFVRGASADFVVAAMGYRRKVITVDSDQKIVLEKGISVHFVATGLTDPLPEGVRANIALGLEAVAVNRTRLRPEDLPGRWSGGDFDPKSHAADFWVGEPGLHKVWVSLVNAKKGAELAEDWVKVADIGTKQTFTIAIAPDALRTALEKIEGK